MKDFLGGLTPYPRLPATFCFVNKVVPKLNPGYATNPSNSDFPNKKRPEVINPFHPTDPF